GQAGKARSPWPDPPDSPDPPDHREVLAARAFHGSDRNRAVERRQTPTVLHGQRKQIDVGHLLPANLRGAERGGRAKREIVPPEMMRAVLAEAGQQLDDASSRHVLVDARRVAENA